MIEASLGSAVKVLVPIARIAARKARRLYAERKAGHGVGSAGSVDLMELGVSETLSRLQDGRVDQDWWRRILGVLDLAEQAYITPASLKTPLARKWLQMEAVHEGLVALAKANIMGVAADGEESIRKRLRACYAEGWDDADEGTEAATDVVVAILTAGFMAEIPPEHRAMAAMFQEGFRSFNTRLEQLDVRAKQQSIIQNVLAETAEGELSEILTYSFVSTNQPTKRIEELCVRLEEGGDLDGAPDNVKNKAGYWAARLCAGHADTLEVARRIREGLSDSDTEESLLVVDALIAATEGDQDKAMRLVREVDDPDARSVFLGLSGRFGGEEEALAWCADVDPAVAPGQFTEAGWRAWAVFLTKVGRWQEAARGLRDLAQHAQWTPAVAFIEGAINAALLLPAERRDHMFGPVPLYAGVAPSMDPTAEQHRRRAVACFEFLAQNVVGTKEANLREAVADWRLWLRLMDSIAEESQMARLEIGERMRDGSSAVRLIGLAWAFDVDFDDEALRTRLRQNERLGGLSDDEIMAQCLLNERTMGERDFAAYLEEHLDRIDRVMMAPATTALLFEALLTDGQTDRARALVSKRGEHLNPAMLARMNHALDTREGTDPRVRLEELYRESESLVDLRNLIAHLKEVEDYGALRGRLRELFDLEHTLPNAYELVGVLTRRVADHASLLEFLDEYPGLVEQGEEFRSAKAWALFHAGRLDEARALNDELLGNRSNSTDLVLDVNLAVVSGDWDRLPAIAGREWRDRLQKEPEVLMALAEFVCQSGHSPERALELARLAAELAPTDPRILASTYCIHLELGREDQANAQWLAQAVEYSTEAEGPIWKADLKELVDQWLPKLRERNERVERMLLSGKVPIALAVGMLNVPLSRVFMSRPRDGGRERDGRGQPIIPIVSGVRRPVHLQQSWMIGVDVTSMMVLQRLGLLEKAIGAFEAVKISPEAMTNLFAERAVVRFHQPARVRQARQIQRLFQRGRITVMDRSAVVKQEAVDELGDERAALLEECRREGGIAICVKPLHKAKSSMEELADTSAYEGVIFSPADLCSALWRRGLVDAESFERAKGFLASQGQVAEADLPESMLDGSVYMDELALSYLQSAQLLETVANGELDLRAHPAVLEMANGLVDGGDVGDDVANELEGVVATLRNAMEYGAVSLVPRISGGPEDEQGRLASMGSLEGLVLAGEQCDALLVDDRYFNSHHASSGPTGEPVPIICVLDVLRYLRAQEVVDEVEYWAARHKLRQAGFVFVPIEADELRHWLDATEFDGGQMVESPELRVVRQAVNGVDLAQMADERELAALLDAMRLVSGQVIQELWASPSVTTDAAEALSTWVWRYLVATTFRSGAESGRPFDGAGESIARCIGLLLLPPTVGSADRRSAYRDWRKRLVVDRLKPANGYLIEEALRIAVSTISASEHRGFAGAYFLDCLPDSLRDDVARMDAEFVKDCGIESKRMIALGRKVRLAEGDLFAAAKRVFAGSPRTSVVDSSGIAVTVEPAAKGEGLCAIWDDAEEGPHHIDIPQLGLLCMDHAVRQRALDKIVKSVGATANLPAGLLEQAISRSFSDEEMSLVFQEATQGVVAMHGRLANCLAQGLAVRVDHIVPPSIEYWERFCGPLPDAADPELYMERTLVAYRRGLIEEDLAAGLDICCLGALRDDLSPGAWVEGMDDQTVWEALGGMELKGNPISLLGALDIALYRVGDERFRAFASDVIDMLVLDDMSVDTGDDFYRLFWILCEFELNLLSVVEGAARAPGYLAKDVRLDAGGVDCKDASCF